MLALSLTPDLGLEAVSCGLFVSNGRGAHPDRVLDSYELIVVKKGVLSIWEEEVRFDVLPGHALVLFPARRHRAAAPFGRDLSFYWVHFMARGARAQPFSLNVPQCSKLQRPDCVAELFHRYLDDQEAKRLDPFYAALLLLQILCEVARQPDAKQMARGAALVGRATTYITRHLTEHLSTAKVAAALRVNPDYLSRVFRAVQGLTLTEFIQRRRLGDAAAMLRDSADPVAEIAWASGYASVGHFRRLFRRLHGVSPAAYRRLNARAAVNAR